MTPREFDVLCKDNPDKMTYLGDGLYAFDRGFDVMLFAPREYDVHMVALDDSMIDELSRWLNQKRTL